VAVRCTGAAGRQGADYRLATRLRAINLGAEALSGLARAFFYSGARALLVSHRAVESNAAMRLTTSTFNIMKSDPTLGRAEALRRAMFAFDNL